MIHLNVYIHHLILRYIHSFMHSFTFLLPNCECEMSVLDLSHRMLHVHQFLTTHKLKNAEKLVSNLWFFVNFRVSTSRGRLRFLAVDCISHRNKMTINSYRFAQNAVNLTCFDNHTAKFLKPLLCLPINRLRGNQWCTWAQIYLLPLFFPVCLFVCKMVLVEKDIFGFASQSFFD